MKSTARRNSPWIVAVLILLAFGCKTGNDGSSLRANDVVFGPTTDAKGVMALPQLSDAKALEPFVDKELKAGAIAANRRSDAIKRIAHYLAFLGLKPGDGETDDVLTRLLESSTQFILCDDFEDWACLEQKPVITPSKKSRHDASADLGKMINVSHPLKMEYYFTEQWDVELSDVNMSKMLALKLAAKITQEAKDGISMAIYGIDATTGSMKPVYDALTAKIKAGVDVRAVVDTEDLDKDAKAPPYVFAYKKPASGQWIFDDLDNKTKVMDFQYGDTVKLINLLNANASSDDEIKGRLEYPDGGIMHNKFLVFKKGSNLSLWTGTANIADTCMGTERNTNMSLFIDDTDLASSFLGEFEEMYAYRDAPYSTEKLVSDTGAPGIKVGSFHNNKTPNTRRYFHYSDGLETRVHFAPTDDGEHRSIMPMLLSARKGDQIRVSMFGDAGFEAVRAFQWAQAKGVDVRIVLDRFSGSGTTSWIRDSAGNVLEQNPYDATPSGSLVVRRSTWKKQNHHKIGTLTRLSASGLKPEVAIIGSQNWSTQGNDKNDENMITFRSSGAGLEIASAFNSHFDKRLWVQAASGELKQGTPYESQVGPESDEGSGEAP